MLSCLIQVFSFFLACCSLLYPSTLSYHMMSTWGGGKWILQYVHLYLVLPAFCLAAERQAAASLYSCFLQSSDRRLTLEDRLKLQPCFYDQYHPHARIHALHSNLFIAGEDPSPFLVNPSYYSNMVLPDSPPFEQMAIIDLIGFVNS